MLGLLRLDGYRWVHEPEGADLVVVNTCGFIDTARDESIDAIRQMAELKRNGRLGGIIVTGCLAERDREALLEGLSGDRSDRRRLCAGTRSPRQPPD